MKDWQHCAADEEVRSLYREIAQERTPGRLDESVLAGARRARLAGVWLRPLAVAASIGLCLAIVLQLGSVPQPGMPAAVPVAPPDEAVHQAAVESRAQKMGDSLHEKSAVQPVREASDGIADERDGQAASATSPSGSGHAAVTAANTPGPGQADEWAGGRTGCTADDRSALQSWLACIAAMEAAGDAAGAQSEQDALQRRHPAYRPAAQ